MDEITVEIYKKVYIQFYEDEDVNYTRVNTSFSNGFLNVYLFNDDMVLFKVEMYNQNDIKNIEVDI